MTMADRIIQEMETKGYKLVGQTRGLYSFRKGSNLDRKLQELGLTDETCTVKTGARAGKFRNDGHQLLIFTSDR